MKTKIYVNPDAIVNNAKTGRRNSVIACDRDGEEEVGHEAIIYGQDGKEAARIVYMPNNPLSAGAKVWVETENTVEVNYIDYEDNACNS